MRALIAAVLCAGLGLAGAARADLEKGAWAPDIEARQWKNTDEPISLYECKGMVVVLFFWVSWHQGGEYIMPLMNFVNSEFGRSQGVYLIGLTDAELARVDEMLEKERVLFPVGAESKSYEDYEISSFPRVVIIDPNGKVAWTGWPGASGGEALVREIRAVVAEVPPTRTHPEEAAKVRAYLAQARQALRGDDYRKAYRAARSALERALTGDPLKTRCQDMVDLIEALGRDKLAQAERAIDDKNYEDTVTLLREVMREFKGADVAQAASKRLSAIRKKFKEVADLIAQQEDEGLAENLLAEALDEFRSGAFGKAYDRLEQILSEYGSTPAAAKAQTVIDRVRKHDAIMAQVRDHQAEPECLTLLSQARAYMRAGRPNEAKKLLGLIVEKHADTIWAEQARRLLAELP